MEKHNETAEIITALTPSLLAAFGVIQSCIALYKAHLNRKRIDKVETALYDSPAINGPYKDRRTAPQTTDTGSEGRRKTDK